MKRGQAFCSFLVSLGVGEVKSANKLCALVQEQTDFLYSRAFPDDVIQNLAANVYITSLIDLIHQSSRDFFYAAQ